MLSSPSCSEASFRANDVALEEFIVALYQRRVGYHNQQTLGLRIIGVLDQFIGQRGRAAAQITQLGLQEVEIVIL